MSIKSFGNPNARYKATMSRTGDLRPEPISFAGNRGLWGGGTGWSNVIDYVSIPTTGNATDFGDLQSARGGVAGAAGASRGVFFGGMNPNAVNTICLLYTSPSPRDS